LNTLQKYGVHGRPSSTLQGACENGVASMGRRWPALAVPATVIPAIATTRQITTRRSMSEPSKAITIKLLSY
jgi:hypothetical protein